MFLRWLLFVIAQACSMSIKDLHEFMDGDELDYYFKSDRNSMNKFEVVYLPTLVLEREAIGTDGEDDDFRYEFEAFGDPVHLNLKRNKKLISDNFKSFIIDGENKEFIEKPRSDCHYLHADGNTVGAVSICIPKRLQGLLFLQNRTLEIHPLTQRLEAILKVREPLLEDGMEDKVPHIIKHVSDNFFHEDAFPTNEHSLFPHKMYLQHDQKRANNRPASALTLELALFFDAAGYRIFAPYMGYDDDKLQDMLLAYMNGVQALYHHPSLGTTLELTIVRMDIMKNQPSAMPHYEGERGKLLDSFCEYQDSINPKADADPDHWDMALYVSGLDFFAYENGKKSGVTMGLATVGGVCLGQYACIIAELGTTNVFGKPYPSAGFTSVYILAHEIGHNLGMHHDGTGNRCPKEGYVMSPSRGTNGETQWSTCSAEVMSKLSWAKCLFDSGKPPSVSMDHKKFADAPGQVYTAKKQCEILLRDKDAVMSPNQQVSTICYNLQCKTPHRSGYYFAGPALEGTECGRKQYCYGGECVDKEPQKPLNVIPGGWSAWKPGSCSSGCILNSKGYQDKHRYCNNPVPVNTDEGCDGNSYEVGLCKDDKLCAKKKRKSPSQFASEKCREFSSLLPQLDPKGSGLQAPHEEDRIWMGCAIFCRRADSGTYYTPRIELNDLGVSPYFPDGTWCHKDMGTNYYCIRHHCLPENFQFTKTFMNGLGEDIPIPQNAHPNDLISGDLLKYLSLGHDGKPMLTALKPEDTDKPNEEDWETNDYIELPKSRNEILKNAIEEDPLDFME